MLRRLHLPVPAHPVMLMTGVLALAAAVTTSATVVQLDAALGSLARSSASELSHLYSSVSALAATDLVLPFTVAAALGLCLVRHWGGALTLLVAVFGTQAVVQLIKVAVERPRPGANTAATDAAGFSFPSAHSATAVALYATLTFLAARACSGWARTAIVAAGTAVVLAVGASRILLAAHYPIDVVAGWLTGAALVSASWLLATRVAALRVPARAS